MTIPNQPDKLNYAYVYTCRNCKSTYFRVCWYTAPQSASGAELDPGWAIECMKCSRVTLLPEIPDLSERRRSR